MIKKTENRSWKKALKCVARNLCRPSSGAYVVADMTMDEEKKEIIIGIRPTRKEQCRCGICHRVYEDMERKQPARFDGLVNIGIDETSYKKGHKYMTEEIQTFGFSALSKLK